MSRLTEKVDNEKLLEADIRYLTRNQDGIYAVLNKLGELEDLEEQGRLKVQGRGQWDILTDEYDCEYMKCSVCGEEFYPVDEDTVDRTYNYCPNCGAKMDEVENE